jgi:hypothetical protein
LRLEILAGLRRHYFTYWNLRREIAPVPFRPLRLFGYGCERSFTGISISILIHSRTEPGWFVKWKVRARLAFPITFGLIRFGRFIQRFTYQRIMRTLKHGTRGAFYISPLMRLFAEPTGRARNGKHQDVCL